jgi:hypothetical protein
MCFPYDVNLNVKPSNKNVCDINKTIAFDPGIRDFLYGYNIN